MQKLLYHRWLWEILVYDYILKKFKCDLANIIKFGNLIDSYFKIIKK